MKEITIEQRRAKWREYYRNNAVKYRETHRLRVNKRYREDDEYRERTKKRNLARYYERKAERAKQ